MGGRFCKYQTHLLKWTCFSNRNNNNSKKSSERSKAYYTLPAIFIRSQLQLLPFFTFSTIKKGEIKIQTKHKYTYRTNTKAKIGIFLQYIQIVCIALNKNLFEKSLACS